MKIQKVLFFSTFKFGCGQNPTDDPGEIKELIQEEIKMGRIHEAMMKDFNLHSGPRGS